MVMVAGNEIGTGKFRTLSSEALAQIDKRKPSEKAEFSDRILFTLMLQEMGATQEARESWSRLAQERADLPELAAFAKCRAEPSSRSSTRCRSRRKPRARPRSSRT